MPFNPQTGVWDAFDPTGGAATRQPAIPQLQPEEEDSLLKNITGKAMGGLAYVGGTLDKLFGGRAIRGALGGKARELLSVIPGSDTIGLTNEQDRVSGEDLLKNAGILQGEGEKGSFELRDLAGPALEMALDPATYLTFGGSAINKAGQAAKRAGTLPKTMAGRIEAGMGGLAGVRLPFQDPFAVLGTGETAQKVAGALGTIGDKAAYSGPGRALSALFDRSANGTTSETLQRAGRQAEEMTAQRLPGALEPIIDEGRHLANLSAGGGSGGLGPIMSQPQVSDQLRSMLEGVTPIEDYTTLGESAKRLRAMNQGMADTETNLGMNLNQMQNYMHREWSPLDQPTKGFGSSGQPQSAAHGSMIGRTDEFRDIPGGTDALNQILSSPQLRDMTPLQRAKDIRSRYLGVDDQKLFDMQAIAGNKPLSEAEKGFIKAMDEVSTVRPLTQDEIERVSSLRDRGARPVLDEAQRTELERMQDQFKRANSLATRIDTVDPAYAANGLVPFGNHVLHDMETRVRQHVRSTSKAEALFDLISKVAGPSGEGTVPLTDVVKSLDQLKLGNEGAVSKQLSDRLTAAGKMSKPEDYFGMHVPKDVAEQLPKYVQGFTNPEALSPVLKAWDGITSAFKAGVTAAFPSKYLRDMAQGVFNGWVHDSYDPRYSKMNPEAWVKPYKDASTVIREGKVLEDANQIPALKGMSPEQATNKLADWMHLYGVAGPEKMTQAKEMVGQLAGKNVQKTFPLPGEREGGLWENIAKAAKEGTWNPLDVSGIGGRTTTTAKWAAPGAQAMTWIDDMGRGSTFIAKLRQGFSPEAAADVVKKAHYDYANLSGFEKNVMRRVMPWYSWTRQNVPAVLEQLATQPGGKVGASLKTEASLNRDQGFTPPYLNEGLALKAGKEENGNQRFLTSTGTTYEDALRHLQLGGPNPVSDSLRSVASEMHPLLKAPIELATGKQLMSGRPLNELYGSTGSPVVDQLLYNSPISRLVTSGRTLMDERKDAATKAVNLLTPVKLADVDMAKQREIAARDYIEKSLATAPDVHTFNRLYVSPQNVPNLSHNDLQMLQLYQSQEKRAQELAKQKKIGVRTGG